MYKFILSLLVIAAIYAEEPAQEQDEAALPPPDAAKISEAFGHLIGKNLESMGFKFDIAQIVKGLQDAAAGRDAPMTEMECVQAISAIQEVAFKQQAVDNLKKAEEFLTSNAKKTGIVTVEPGRLQYQIDRVGTGPVVQDHFSPLIRYTGKFLDGSIFGSSKEDEIISLDETIPGFTKGMIGMKEGEKRILFIHPDLGYGASGYLPPNSLLQFEIEVVQANSPHADAPDTISSTHPKIKGNPEIASPVDEVRAIR